MAEANAKATPKIYRFTAALSVRWCKSTPDGKRRPGY